MPIAEEIATAIAALPDDASDDDIRAATIKAAGITIPDPTASDSAAMTALGSKKYNSGREKEIKDFAAGLGIDPLGEDGKILTGVELLGRVNAIMADTQTKGKNNDTQAAIDKKDFENRLGIETKKNEELAKKLATDSFGFRILTAANESGHTVKDMKYLKFVINERYKLDPSQPDKVFKQDGTTVMDGEGKDSNLTDIVKSLHLEDVGKNIFGDAKTVTTSTTGKTMTTEQATAKMQSKEFIKKAEDNNLFDKLVNAEPGDATNAVIAEIDAI